MTDRHPKHILDMIALTLGDESMIEYVPNGSPFKYGDIVRLKSGGPPMTVLAIVARETPFTSFLVECVWFNKEDNSCAQSFYSFSLVPFHAGD